MKESIGYTVTLNLMIVFIAIIFTFLSATLIYYKSNKLTNIIVNSLEKYEGYNDLSSKDIDLSLNSIGYQAVPISCKSTVKSGKAGVGVCNLNSSLGGTGDRGYCIYECIEDNENYYYRIRVNMLLNVPIINNILDIPIYSNTNILFDFEDVIK